MECTDRKTDKGRIQIKDMAFVIERVQNLFLQAGISIPLTHSLSRLCSEINAYLKDPNRDSIAGSRNVIFSILELERISESIFCLETEERKFEYLQKLLQGELCFHESRATHAKDIFWELELYTKFKNKFSATELNEPDIVVKFKDCSIAVPCKKIYSEKGVSKVLSNAVAQKERDHNFGIIALNIDEILPGKIIQQNTLKSAQHIVDSYIEEFLDRHRRHFEKYLIKSRISAVLVNASIVVDSIQEKPKFNNLSESTIWSVTNLDSSHKKVIEEFRERLFS